MGCHQEHPVVGFRDLFWFDCSSSPDSPFSSFVSSSFFHFSVLLVHLSPIFSSRGLECYVAVIYRCRVPCVSNVNIKIPLEILLLLPPSRPVSLPHSYLVLLLAAGASLRSLRNEKSCDSYLFLWSFRFPFLPSHEQFKVLIYFRSCILSLPAFVPYFPSLLFSSFFSPYTEPQRVRRLR